MGLFSFAIGKVRKALTRTRDTFGNVRTLLRGQVLNPALIDELESRLIQADIGVATTLRLIEQLRQDLREGRMTRGDQALDQLKQNLIDLCGGADHKIHFAASGPTVILVAGINGAGKTTSIAKLAKALTDDRKTVLLGACDTFRAGAVRQLEIWAERLKVDIIKGQQDGDPSAVAYDATSAALSRGVDVLLIDTAGRLNTQKHLMEQLAKISRVIQKQIPDAPHECILVLDATTGQNAIEQARQFKEFIDVTGVFLSKLDGTAKGGIVVAIREQLGIPVKFIGVGETLDDVEPFDPEHFIEAVFSE